MKKFMQINGRGPNDLLTNCFIYFLDYLTRIENCVDMSSKNF